MTSYLDKDASANEARIARRIVADAIRLGYTISVNDGEAWVVSRSRDSRLILEALASTEYDYLSFGLPGIKDKIGSLLLVWGNGTDLIADHTANADLNNILSGAMDLSDKLQEIADQPFIR